MGMDSELDEMLRLLDSTYASSRTVSIIAVQTELFSMSYIGQNMAQYMDEYKTVFWRLDRMGRDAAIPETHKAPMLFGFY